MSLDALEQRCVERLSGQLASAVRRRSSTECKLSGALLVVAPHSEALLDALERTAAVLVERRQMNRPLFTASLRALLAAGRGVDTLRRSVELSDCDQVTLSACLTQSAVVRSALLGAASKAKGRALFCAEVSRVRRGESQGEALVDLATRLNESERQALLLQLWALGEHGVRLPKLAGPAIAVLRDSERNVGRWLKWAQLCEAPLGDFLSVARVNADDAPRGSKGVWQLVVWALSQDSEDLPNRVPSLNALQRLDGCAGRLEFLFELARAKPGYANQRLQEVAAADDPVAAVRAQMHLAASGVETALPQLRQRATQRTERAAVRALAAAALYDLTSELCSESADTLFNARDLSPSVWMGLMGLAHRGAVPRAVDGLHVRRIEVGFHA